MCGIAGVLTATGEAPRFAPSLDAMRVALRHRGPDDEGAWCAASGSAAFVHTRLAILDLTAAGHQPMSSADGRLTITFNGEILNFRELRRSLEQRGATFQTRSDTEVVLRAYEADGPGCVEQFRGMFAFALWDAREHTCLMARDRFGIKPLYYHADAARLVFASEVRALVASGLVPRELNPDSAYEYFRTGTVPEPDTLLRGVSCLGAGQYATWRDGALTTRTYWSLRFEARTPAYPAAVAQTRSALLDSIDHHFVSDTPVGIFLSGGVDSSALVALAATSGQRDVRTFALTFPGSPFDEGAAARRTAAHFGTCHSEWAMDGRTAQDLFTQCLEASDQPSIDGLNTFAVSKFARDSGIKVVLSGLGGDELFGGYKSFEQVPRMASWNRGLSYTGPLRTTVGKGLERMAWSPRWRRVGDLLSQPPALSAAYATFRGIYTRAEARTLAERYTGARPSVAPATDENAGHDPTDQDAMSRLELTRYMRNQPLRDSDTMSMAWGLELRVPFLDPVVVSTLSGIPAAQRLRPHKRLLLDAVPEIPDWVANQPKRGFMFPFQQWLDGEWRDIFAEIDRTSPVPTETWYRKWCVFVLDRWIDGLNRSRQ
jgi:asparagine synthase (glutamine-hydrolysing)